MSPEARDAPGKPGTIPAASTALRVTVLATAALSLSLALSAAWRYDWTYDERFHLHYAERLLAGQTERESRWYFNSKTPIAAVHVLSGRAARAAGAGLHLERYATRLPSVFFLALLYAAIYLLARRRFGEEAALVATGLAACDPSLTAHASIVTVDVALALATVLVLGAALRFHERPTLAAGALLGAALWAAVTAKLSGLLLVPLALLGPPLIGMRPPPRHARALAGGLAAGLLCFTFLLAASYGFARFGDAGGVAWRSDLFRELLGIAPWIAALLPVDFLSGIDISLADERTVRWRVALLGEIHPDGVPHYFLLCWLVKTPIALLAAVAVGAPLALAAARREPALRFIALAFALIWIYFSLIFRAQVGYRFALLLLPLAYLLAGSGIASLGRARLLAPAVFLLSLLEIGFYAANPLSFTNAFIRPAAHAYQVIADSNLDFGQNDVSVFARARRIYPEAAINPPHLLPGTNVVSVNLYAGVWPPDRYARLRRTRLPDTHLDHTHLVFFVSDEEFEELLERDRTLEEARLFTSLCDPDAPRRAITALELEARQCLIVDEPTDIALEWGSPGARALLLHARGAEDLVSGPVREHALIHAGDQVWYRLRAGVYPIATAPAGRVTLRVERGKIHLAPW